MPLTLGTISGEGERTPFTLTRTDQLSSSIGGTGTTVSTTKNIGTAASDRVLIIPVGAGTSNYIPTEITTVTVGGVSATRIVSIGGNSASNSYSAAFFVVPYPTGTTATIVLTFAAGVPDRVLSFAIYAAYGMQSATPVATDSALYTSGTLTRNIRARSGGRIIGFNFGFIHFGGKTWTNLTIDYNFTYGSSATAGFNRGQTVSVGYDGAGTDSALVLASFA